MFLAEDEVGGLTHRSCFLVFLFVIFRIYDFLLLYVFLWLSRAKGCCVLWVLIVVLVDQHLSAVSPLSTGDANGRGGILVNRLD